MAAQTFSNELTGTVEFEDGTKVRGVSSMVEGAGPADVVLSSEIPKAGVPAEDARLCAVGALDPEAAAGKIVLCDRGVTPRVDKSKAVAEAGTSPLT